MLDRYMHPLRRMRLVVVLAAVALIAAVAAGCGSSNSGSAAGNGTDLAFVNDMVPHHSSAVDMAKVAQQRGQRSQIKTLANNIVSSQNAEITQMKAAKQDLVESDVKPASLGVPMHAMGMDMKTGELATAKPFDRAFIDMMVPHHQGAIRMARVELAKGESPALKKLAQQIIDAQTKEIGEMNRWRTTWYGKPSPAGGVPAADASMKGVHDGHSG